MTPADFIAACVARSVETGAVVTAVDDSGVVLSPVVIPGPVVAELTDLPSTDLVELVRLLEGRFAVVRLLAPEAAARVTSVADVTALQLFTSPETS